MTKDLQPITFALTQVSGKSVVIFNRDQWTKLISDTGEPTKLSEAPAPLNGVMSQATIVTITASSIINSTPGVDIVRYDQKDAPHVYNIDHYTVIENLSRHKEYSRILAMARIEDGEELQTVLQENIFIVGPERLGHHWSIELPAHIKNAKPKR